MKNGQIRASTVLSNLLCDLLLKDGLPSSKLLEQLSKAKRLTLLQEDLQNITNVQLAMVASQLRKYKLITFFLSSILLWVSLHGMMS